MKIPLMAALYFVAASVTLQVSQIASAQSSEDSAAVASAAAAFPTPDAVVNILANKLALTDEQKNTIAPIIADRQTQMKALLTDSSSRPLQRRRQMRQLMSDSDA